MSVLAGGEDDGEPLETWRRFVAALCSNESEIAFPLLSSVSNELSIYDKEI